MNRIRQQSLHSANIRNRNFVEEVAPHRLELIADWIPTDIKSISVAISMQS